jgi:hypothetical protein
VVSGAVKADTIAWYRLVQVDQRVGAENETTANRLVDWDCLKCIEGEICDGPDNRMDSLLNVKRDRDHGAGVVANGDASEIRKFFENSKKLENSWNSPRISFDRFIED